MPACHGAILNATGIFSDPFFDMMIVGASNDFAVSIVHAQRPNGFGLLNASTQVRIITIG